jgi:erythromycin esterase
LSENVISFIKLFSINKVVDAGTIMPFIRKIYFFSIILLLSCNTWKLVQTQKTANQVIPTIIPWHPLRNDSDLDILLQAVDTCQIVLLGEATHGTSEYYTWRTAISKRLIKEKGFCCIAVEGDWSDACRVNDFINAGKSDSIAVIRLLEGYQRWPTWLWGNYEMVPLIHWLTAYNQIVGDKNKIGFYGLDLFNIAGATDDLLQYIGSSDTALRVSLSHFIDCFTPYAGDEEKYPGKDRALQGGCAIYAEQLHRSVGARYNSKLLTGDSMAVGQDESVITDGERYLRTRGNAADAWNLRENHMLETVNRLLRLRGPNAKLIIWAHNSHSGASRFGSMNWAGKTSLANLLKYQYGTAGVFIAGFGSFTGSFIAAEKWNGSYKKMEAGPADDSSWEQKLQQEGADNKIVLSSELKSNPANMRWISHRNIGVIYNPAERGRNYSFSVIPERYDAFLFFNQTHALHPLKPPDDK